MNPDGSPVPYHRLVAVADHLFEECEEDVKCLSHMIDALDPALRNELLVSDLLNAYQVFYYFSAYCLMIWFVSGLNWSLPRHSPEE